MYGKRLGSGIPHARMRRQLHVRWNMRNAGRGIFVPLITFAILAIALTLGIAIGTMAAILVAALIIVALAVLLVRGVFTRRR